jgi:hypothetical protein
LQEAPIADQVMQEADQIIAPDKILQQINHLKSSISKVQQGVQSGEIEAYKGIPFIKEQIDTLQQLEAKLRPTHGIDEAQSNLYPQETGAPAPRGIETAPSNLPTQMAGGGIIAFDDGGLAEDDEDDTDNQKQDLALFKRNLAAMSGEDDIDDSYDDDEEMPEGIMAAMTARKGATENRGVGVKPDRKSGEGIQYTDKKHKYEKEIRDAARNAGISEDLFLHMMAKETGGLANPESARSKAGAMGIAQFMPATAKQYGIDPMKMDEALPAAAKMTSNLLKHYGGDQKLAAMAYNWGQGNVDKWLSSGADPSKVPGETQGYTRAAEGGIMKLAGGGVVAFGNPKLNPDEEQLVEDDENFIDPGTAALFAPSAYQATKGALKNVRRLPPGALSGVPTAIGRTLGSTGTAYLGAAGETALPAAGVGYGGYKASQAAARTMARPEMAENRKVLQDNSMLGAMSGDTAFASAILDAAERNPNATPAVKSTTQAAPANTPPVADLTGSKMAGDAFRLPVKETDNERQAREDAAKVKEREAMGAGPDDISSLKEMLDERAKSAKNQKNIDNYMALLQAGLGMMGGTSPYAAANIGQGGAKGIAALADSRKSQIAEENAILSGRLGLSRAQLYEQSRKDALARGIASDKFNQGYKNNMYGLNVSKAMQTQAHNTNVTQLKARELYDKNGGDIGLRQKFAKQYGKNWESDANHMYLFKQQRQAEIGDYLGDASAILGGGGFPSFDQLK